MIYIFFVTYVILQNLVILVEIPPCLETRSSDPQTGRTPTISTRKYEYEYIVSVLRTCPYIVAVLSVLFSLTAAHLQGFRCAIMLRLLLLLYFEADIIV